MNIKLRAPETKDIGLIYIWENSTEEMHTSLRTGPVSRHAISRYIDNYTGDIYNDLSLRLMIDCNDETVGTLDIYDFDPHARHASIGIYIAPRFRRRGVALGALKDVENYLLKQVSLKTILAIVSVDNIPSLSLFETAGYTKCGVLKKWLRNDNKYSDAVLLQRILQD